MKALIKILKSQPINILLIAIPLAVLAKYLGWGAIWVFIFTSAGIIPLAGFIGQSTESLAHFTGPRIGGLLNATLGNAAELIITIVAIREGLLELVKASITGSILGNVLLVMGMSMVIGGLRNGVQFFDRRQAGNNAILLVLAVVGLVIPSLLSGAIGPEHSVKVETLSLGVSGTLIVLYALGLLFSFKHSNGAPTAHSSEQGPRPKPASVDRDANAAQAIYSLRTALAILAVSTIGVAYLSEMLVGVVEEVVVRLGVSEFFLGVILIPIVGNVAEHLVSVKVAFQNQMELSVGIAISSSLQIALFVAPVLVFVSLALGHPLQLIFNEFELLALITGVLIAALVSADGESNWLEGAELLAVYVILGLAFFLLPV
jgi:Ca2+:H+ antiporter